MHKIKIEIPSEFCFVRGVRECISAIAYSFGFNGREVYHIETIVDEICNNAIEHGGIKKTAGFNAKAPVKIECKFDMGSLELKVTDKGAGGINLSKILEYSGHLLEKDVFANPAKRGRGLVIVQKFADKLDIKTNKGSTTVMALKKACAVKS